LLGRYNNRDSLQTLCFEDIAPNFKIGDKVRIRKDTRYHNYDSSNPPNSIVGKISTVRTYSNYTPDTIPITVDWPDSYRSNSYNFEDLEYAESVKEIIEEPKLPIKIYPIEKLPEIQQKNQVLIASLQLLSTRKYIKVETILEQLKVNQPEYEWDTKTIYTWLEKLNKFRQTKTGNFALKN